MPDLLILGVIATTSLAAIAWGTLRLSLPLRCLVLSFGRLLECLGVAVVFLMVNGGTAVLVVFGVRALAGRFVPLHVAAAAVWLPLSLLQALLFVWWRHESVKSRAGTTSTPTML